MLVFNKDVTLADKMRQYDMKSLKYYASELGLTKLSKLRKEELVQKIVENLLDPKVMFYRGAILSEKEIAVLEKGFDGPIEYSNSVTNPVGILNEMDFAIVGNGKYIVPNDVAKVWKEIKNDKFLAYHKKASWVWKCLYWAENMYAVTPMEIFLQVVNTQKGMRLNQDEIMELFSHFPEDRLWSVLMQDVFLSKIYSDNFRALEHIRHEQANKDYYIPFASDVEELAETGVLISGKEYRDMEAFLVKEVGMDQEDVEDTLMDLWDKLNFNQDMHDTMQWFWNRVSLGNDNQVKKIVNLYNALANNTRMLHNRGHKPVEIMRKQNFGPGNMPVITAGSTKAAELLQQAAPQIKQMGFEVDLEANTSTIPVMGFPNGLNGKAVVSEKKIYPNDPCPCGSGKKYKKCCGRA